MSSLRFFLHSSDTSTTSATFLTLNLTDNAALPPTMPSTTFKFTFSKESRELSLFVDGSTTDSNWLTFVLFKKIQSWMESCVTKNDQLQIESHSLISSELYNEVYAELKEKYGKKLEESWEESTDPKKFIYEDIAIASYLISLWKNDRKGDNLQSFCDLGCGNGLLVFILSQEGHRGYGIDLRKRKIWDKFPAETDLRENAIVPSDQSLFTDVDWIIGNHSDELSPWISILAARSSFRSKYFLLPCCAFEFSGEKYQRKSGAKSQYLSYIDYLMEISNVCGFADTKLDRLKIPSTKRICLIGTQRNYKEENFQHQCEKIQNFINATNSQQTKGSSEKWSTSFTPREKLEAVKNCTKIDKMLSDSIVKRIFEKVLSLETLSDGWSSGGILPLPEAVKLVSQDELKQLKSECGGLQTLLKNKHQIFHIYNGSIQIRAPKKLSENLISARSMKRNVVKTVPCYFFLNHPNSCPILDDDCCYIH